MFKGFNVKISNAFSQYVNAGKMILESNQRNVYASLEKYLTKNGNLDGSAMQQDWFTPIKADIFLSHSHRDENFAYGLAGWLFKEFSLEVFIDSAIWGYSNSLLKQIDNKYCMIPDKELYDYEKRNISTSHVHMMLMSALTMMIDKTESLFFLNTIESLNTEGMVSKTESPWIYSEITVSKYIRSLPPVARNKELIKSLLSEENRSFSELAIEYDADIDHLYKITDVIVAKWKNFNNQLHQNSHPLDILYSIFKINY